MNPSNPHSPMIFTLEDDQPQRELTDNSNEMADWEHSLQQLRSQQPNAMLNQSSPEHITIVPPRDLRNENDERFGDEELDRAYREYLRQREAQHNHRVRHVAHAQTDVGVLLQEDWLAAQTALLSERNRRHLQAAKTVILNGDNPMQEVDLNQLAEQGHDAQNWLPACTVHVYDLPDLPSTRRIRILSEQELMQRIQDKLQVHLSNAMAGLVRQAVQKKLATLTYDLQVMLNDETAKVVHDVLEHNLSAVFRSVKDAARDE